MRQSQAIAELHYEFALMRNSSDSVMARNDMRVRIQWESIEGYPMDYDNCTIVDAEFTPYVMLVRVGWIGNNPQLMAFPNVIGEFDEFNRPVIREWNGIPFNYRGYTVPGIRPVIAE